MVKTVRRPVASNVQDLTILVTTQMDHVTRAVSLATKDICVLKVSGKTNSRLGNYQFYGFFYRLE